MKHALLKSAAAFALLALCSLLAFGQTTSTGSLSGTVLDPTGAAVAGAAVSVKNSATGVETTATTNEQGSFTVPALNAGTYTVTITPTTGFKQAILKDVKISIGQPSTVDVKLEVGQVTESVTITGAGGELINSTNANVSTTITGRQITDLPFTSRNALDLILLLPGSQTPGRPRQSTVNGLSKGALNITLDGINIQDNLLKSNDGFFTYVQPKIDAVDEVTLSTATPGAESSGEGAVQIKFSTRSGGNAFHGSLYEYHRNPSLNANYYFNNETLPPDPVDHTAPRNRILLNQFGGRIGGPITIPHLFNGRDRAFFFINYEEYRLPERSLRQRTTLNPTTATGVFQYTVGGTTRTLNLLTLAAANGLPSTIDPTVGALLGSIQTAVTGAGGGFTQLSDPNLQRAAFINPGGQNRRFPTSRFDFNVTKNHHISDIYNYQQFKSVLDFLNNVDPAFPGFPNHGSQDSNRFSNTIQERWTVTPNIINEASFGLTGGTVLFFPEVSPAQFANQNGFNINGGFSSAGITGPSVVTTPQRRNTPVQQFNDNVTWVKGTHAFAFGGSFTRIHVFSAIATAGIIPAVTFSLPTGDPALTTFTAANIPGASTAQVSAAQGIYAFLTGRISTITNTLVRDESSGNFTPFGNLIQRAAQKEAGFYAQDTWRFRPNLTLTAGVRDELQFGVVTQDKTFSSMSGGYNGLFGISCSQQNLFVPGNATCPVASFVETPVGTRLYNNDFTNFAPSAGFAWSPDWKGGFLGRAFGSGGKTVFRGGFSMAYIREGDLNVALSTYGSNQGPTLALPRSVASGTLSAGNLFRNIGSLAPPTNPSSPTFPIVASPTNNISSNTIDPNLKMGYAESWTVGIQREITKDMVFEARYVGTRGHRLQHQYNFDEINVASNGFINEFALAQQNFLANIAAGRGSTFRYFGAGTGTSPLPILFGLLQNQSTANANNAALYTSTNFASTTFTQFLAANGANPQAFANVIISNPGVFTPTTFANAGLPRNLFLVNPDTRGGAFTVDNSGQSWYDGMTLEVRRRMKSGLLMDVNYTWSKSESLGFSSSSVVAWQPSTLRNLFLDKTFAPFDIRHALKANFIYELPFGRGKKWLDGRNWLMSGLVGGWELHGTLRTQSGSPVDLGNVQLVGMTAKDLQHAVEIRKDPNHIVYYLPQDIIDNTIRAFNVTSTGFSLGAPTGRYIAPPNSNGCLQSYVGQCGFAHLILHGPRFNRFDMSVVKKFKFSENKNLELRAEFLDLPNAINFLIGSAANDVNAFNPTAVGSQPNGGTLPAISFASQAFGQTSNAYQDLSTTNDPGGRLFQLVIRFNF
jgi:hypothetical protein